MGFLGDIVRFFNDVSDFFYDAYREVYDWVSPFWRLSYPLYDLCLVFNRLAWAFSDFGDLIYDWEYLIDDILSWSNIRSLIRSWLPDLEDAIQWFWDWYDWVTDTIDDWWSSTRYTVQSWIDIAKSYLQSQLNSLTSWVATLQAAIDELELQLPNISGVLAWFSNWWGNILTNLTTWWSNRLTDITNLIDSAFLVREPFWAGWQDWKTQITEFFTDPLEWLYNRAEEFFDRYW